jgi:signal transduction histidine kinase
MRIRDDGKGIDPQVLNGAGRVGHWGLAGMRERAKLIGGKLEVWSSFGSGTEIELSVPASIAYIGSATGLRSWFYSRGA